MYFFSFLHRNSRSCTVPEINAFLHFTEKFKMAAKNSGKTIFVKCCHYTLQIPCGSKLSSKLLYLAPFPRLYVFVFYTESQDGRPKWRKSNFGEKLSVDSVYTVWVKNFVKINPSRTVFKINALLRFMQNSRWPVDSADILQVKNFIESLYLAPFPR